MEELHAPVLSRAYVALPEGGLGKEHPGLLLLDKTPAKLAGFVVSVHPDIVSNIRT
jgi:hypothetical protein